MSMGEFHAYYSRVRDSFPMLLPTIVSAIRSAYEETRAMLTLERMKSKFYHEYLGYFLHPCVQMRASEAVSDLEYSGIEISCVKNAGKNYSHVEIHLPWAVITVHYVADGENKPRDSVYGNNLTAGQVGWDDILGCSIVSKVHLAVIHRHPLHTLDLKDIRLISMGDYVGGAGVLDVSIINEATPEVLINTTPTVTIREEIIQPLGGLRLKSKQ
jgi:hypothetical protein